jgi:FKBP-type peptidyl-prolyl cis-trans isomerase
MNKFLNMMLTEKKTRLLVGAGIILILVASCDPYKKYDKQQAEEIQAFIDSHPEYDFQMKKSGLYYFDIEVGTGPAAVTHDTAYIKYTATYLSGDTLYTNVGTNDTLSFPINEGYTLLGVDESITYMKEGGKAALIVPSELGYGNSGYYFPAWTPIFFEINLVKIVPSTGK